MSRRLTPALRQRFRRVRMLLCDVDGVLTNATVFIGDGREFKEFSIHDGLGIRLLQEEGIQIGWISARPSTATRQRAEELQIDFLHQAKGSKVDAIEGILQQAGISWAEICFIGDDIVDLGPLSRAGVGVAVANAVPEAKRAADYVTELEGGRGAVREVITLILQAQGRWKNVIARYTK